MCGIQYGEYIFITGSSWSATEVYFWKGLLDTNHYREISSLNVGRRNHGCTSFVDDSGVTKVII